MDTDWCIVCDTRISSETGYLSELNNDDENTNNSTIETVENGALQPSSWAFCSTNCFNKAYDEAQSKNLRQASHHPTKISKRSNTFPLKPLHQHPASQKDPHPHKLFFDSDGSSSSSSGSKSNHQHYISPFTFGSYGSSSMSSSNFSSVPAAI